MSSTLEVVLWWAAFAGAHLLMSSLPIRRRLVARLGDRVFQGVYSLVVLGLFVGLVLAYFAHKHAGPVLWALPPGPVLRWTMYAGSALALVLIVGSQITPSPANMIPGAPRARGVLRITRHPFVMGTVIWALVHLLGNGSASDVAFFGGFVAFGIIGAAHQDARKLAANVPGYRDFVASTPFLPFVGPGAFEFRELVPAAVVGIAATLVIRHFHASWFGG